MIVTIDGPSGTGKSTVAKRLAAHLGFSFFDTGAMYRAVAWWIRNQKLDADNQEEIAKQLPFFQYEIKTDSAGHRRYFVGVEDVTEQIRTQEISLLASRVATSARFKENLVTLATLFLRGGIWELLYFPTLI